MSKTSTTEIPIVGNIKFVMFHHMGHGDSRDMISGHVATLTFEDESHTEDDIVDVVRGVAQGLAIHPFSDGACFSLFRTDGTSPETCACLLHPLRDRSPARAVEGWKDEFRSLYGRLNRAVDAY